MRHAALGVIVFLAWAVLAVPVDAEAQPAEKVYRIGWLGPTFPGTATDLVAVFRKALRERGYIEGQTIEITFRSPDRRPERYPELAAQLVQHPVHVILAVTTPAAIAAKQATGTIPVILTVVSDPVGSGLVTSLGQPGGNVTGVTNVYPELAGKHVELLRETLPGISRVAVLVGHSANPGTRVILQQLGAATEAVGARLEVFAVRDLDQLRVAFATMRTKGMEALIGVPGELTIQHQARIAALALEHRLPAFALWLGLTRAGGLMSYRPNFVERFQRAAAQIDKVLRGTRPADLPVERPMTFELAVNLTTAKALNLTIPQSVLVRADEIIEE